MYSVVHGMQRTNVTHESCYRNHIRSRFYESSQQRYANVATVT